METRYILRTATNRAFFANVSVGCIDTRERRDDKEDTFRAPLAVLVKLGNKNAMALWRKDAKIE
jgi:hypothetical protein